MSESPLWIQAVPDPEIKAGDVIKVVGVEGIESFLVTEVDPPDSEDGPPIRRMSGIAWPWTDNA